jgi:hypothetical protein
MEIFKEIKGFEGYYEVSNMGNLRSLDRFVQGEKRSFNKKGKLLNPSVDARGYKYIKANKDFCKRSERKNYRIHRWVISAFTYESDLQVDHINADKTDNRLSNLRYVTNRENSIAKLGKDDDMMYLYEIAAKGNRKKRWVVYIMTNNKRNLIGSRNCINKARKIRDEFILKNNINCFGILRNG